MTGPTDQRSPVVLPRLHGTLNSLWDLILAPPEAKVKDFMISQVIQVNATDAQEEVAAILAKYNLLAVPVTDPAGLILGIATVDDAMESVIPGAWKRRLPRVWGA